MRLTKVIKEFICEEAIEKAFKSKVDESVLALKEKAEAYIIGKGCIKSSECPEKFIKYLNVSSQIHLQGSYNYLPSKYAYIDAGFYFCGYSKNIAEEIYSKWPEYKKLKGLIDSRDSAETDIKAVLSSVNTDNQLIETSPELALFIPEKTISGNYPVALETINRIKSILSED